MLAQFQAPSRYLVFARPDAVNRDRKQVAKASAPPNRLHGAYRAERLSYVPDAHPRPVCAPVRETANRAEKVLPLLCVATAKSAGARGFERPVEKARARGSDPGS